MFKDVVNFWEYSASEVHPVNWNAIQRNGVVDVKY